MQHTSLTLFYLRCARYLVKCYPTSWRERYSEEMLLLLEDFPPTFRTVINLLFHLVDAYTHAHLLNERFPPILQRIRSSELAIYSSAVIFLLAWFLSIDAASTLYGYSQDLRSALSHLVVIAHYGLPLLLLSLLLGGLPILLATAWKGLQAQTYSVLLFLCLGFMCPLLPIFLVVSFGNAIDIAWVLSLCFVSLSLGLTLICIAIQRVTPGRRVTHSALYLATPLPLIMLVGCASLLFCVLPAFTTGSTASYLMNRGFLFWFSSLCLMLLIMTATCSFSLFSLLKGFQAKGGH